MNYPNTPINYINKSIALFLIMHFGSMVLLADTYDVSLSEKSYKDSSKITMLENFYASIREQTLTKREVDKILEKVESNKHVDYRLIDSLVNICWRQSNELNHQLGIAKSAYWRAWLQVPKNRRGLLNFYSIKDATISKNIFDSLNEWYWLALSYDLLASLSIYQYQFEEAANYLRNAEEILIKIDTLTFEYTKLKGVFLNTKGSWAQLAFQNGVFQDSMLAEKCFKNSINYLGRIDAPEAKAKAHKNLGAYYTELRKFDLAEQQFSEAEKLLSNIYDNREKSRIAFFRGQNNLYLYYDDSSNDSIYHTCIAELQRALALSHENRSQVYVTLASAYYLNYFYKKDKADLDLSEQHFSRALKLAVEDLDMSKIKIIMDYSGYICEEKQNCRSKFNEIGAVFQTLRDTSIVIMNEAKALLNQFEIEFLKKKNENERNLRTIYFLLILLGVLLVSGIALYINQKGKVRSLRKEIEAKDAAARAQINPHFISNALFSIDSLLDSGKIRKASGYLVQFDRLYRTVLNSSRKSEISLADEIQFLKNYLSLEQLRFEDRMTFEIKTEQVDSQDRTFIPPMILQPIVENAFKHGIQNLPEAEKGHIELRFNKTNEKSILVKVIDDGVGRKKAQELRAKSVHKPEGAGQKIVKERIEGFQMKGYPADLSVVDRYDDTGKALGTEVNVILPILPTQNLKK